MKNAECHLSSQSKVALIYKRPTLLLVYHGTHARMPAYRVHCTRHAYEYQDVLPQQEQPRKSRIPLPPPEERPTTTKKTEENVYVPEPQIGTNTGWVVERHFN